MKTPDAHDWFQLVRWRLGSVVIDNTLRGLSKLTQLLPKVRSERAQLEVLPDIAYGNAGRAHLLDVYRPIDRDGQLPTMLYVHGGGFRILSKETHWMMAQSFARRGFVVFNINYRLAPIHPYPTPLADVCTAALWVKQNARRFGGDPERIVFAGESAGANLVSSLAIASSYKRPESWARAVYMADMRPRAVLAACGIFQVSDPERFARRKPLPTWLNDRIKLVCRSYLPDASGDPDSYALADPLRFLESAGPSDRPLPPFFVPCGTKDPILEDTRRMHAALDKLSVPCAAPIYPGGVHAFHAVTWRPLAKQCWRDQFDFLSGVDDLEWENPLYQAAHT